VDPSPPSVLMTFSSLAQLKPISQCGQGCVLILVSIQIIFCIVGSTASFWELGFEGCNAGDIGSSGVYVYLLLNQGLCLDSNSDKTSGYDDCTAWDNINANDDTADEDAQKYIDTYGLCVSALVFAIVLLFVTGASYHQIQTEYTNMLRYTQIFLGVLVVALTAGAVGGTSETFYTDEENYPYYLACDNHYTTPTAGWIMIFFCVWVGGGTVGALLFPCGRCAYDEAQALKAAQAQPPDETYNAVVHGPS
jgi:hypothetical protein